MINYSKIILSLQKYNDVSLLIMRALPSYYMFINHGWSKIANPSKWEKYGTFFCLAQKLKIDEQSFQNGVREGPR